MVINTKPPNFKKHIIKKPQAGFTLIEIMVVVVILAIFASVVVASASQSESRKNRAYYEHLRDSMDYIRLTSAERMQPIGIRLVTNQQGQTVPEVVYLKNAYSAHQQSISSKLQNRKKNNMELSVDIRNNKDSNDEESKTPTWTVDKGIDLPTPPTNLTVDINSLSEDSDQAVQPWFRTQQTPQVIWYGTGQASSVSIEIKYNGRLIGDAIRVLPDGSITTTP